MPGIPHPLSARPRADDQNDSSRLLQHVGLGEAVEMQHVPSLNQRGAQSKLHSQREDLGEDHLHCGKA
jgi:hypothetical protein